MRRLAVTITTVTMIAMGLLLPAYADSVENRVAALGAQVKALQSQVKLLTLTTNRALETITSLEGQIATLEANTAIPLKVAYINAEDAFTVFTDAVSYLRQRAIDKQGEIVRLQQQYMASTISKDDFDSQNNQLQVELLQAQLNIDLGTIDKMIASSGFSDMRNDLQRLKDEAQPVVDEMKNLVSTVRVGVIDTTEFQNRYTQVKNAFTQLDQLLTQAATAKIVQSANNVAIDQGYDLVLRTKNVIVYRNTAKMTDITELVKAEIASYL
jgi:Skp family chaperone for outer membrane proteins